MTVDVMTASSDVETINIKEEDDAKSPDVSAEKAVQTPRKVTGQEERPRSGTEVPDDARSQKRAKKALPKPIKLRFRSASK